MQVIEIFSKVSGIRCGIIFTQGELPKDAYKDWVEKQKQKKPPINWEDDSYFKVIEIE